MVGSTLHTEGLMTTSGNDAMQYGAPAVEAKGSKAPVTADAQMILDRLKAEQGDLQQRLASAPPSQRAALEAALASVSGGISSLQSAMATGNVGSISAAMGAATTAISVADTAEALSEGVKAQATGDMIMSQASAQANNWNNPDFHAVSYTQLSAPAKTTYNVMSDLNIGGFNDKDANGVELNSLTKAQMAARVNAELDPRTKAQLQVASVIEKDPKFKVLEETKQQEATVATQQLSNSTNAQLSNEARASQKLSQQVDAPDLAITKIAKDAQSGQISQEEAAARMDKATTDRKQNFAKMAEDTYDKIGKNEQALLRKKFHLEEGQKPSMDQMLTIRKQTPDHKAANEGAWKMKVHGEAGWAMLSPAEQEAYALTHTKMSLEANRKALVSQEFYNALSPEERQELNVKIEKDPKAAPALIALAAEQHKMDHQVSSQMQQMSKGLTQETVVDFVKSSMSSDTTDDYNLLIKRGNIDIANRLHLQEGKERDQFINSGVAFSKTSDFKLTDYNFSDILSDPGAKVGTTKIAALEGLASGSDTTTATSSDTKGLIAETARPVAPSATVAVEDRLDIRQQIASGTPQAEAKPETPKHDFGAMLAQNGFSFSQGSTAVGVPAAETSAPPVPAVTHAQAAPAHDAPHPFAGMLTGFTGFNTRDIPKLNLGMQSPANGNDFSLGHLSAQQAVPTLAASASGPSVGAGRS